jgi:SAM-dependent methyltransferase
MDSDEYRKMDEAESRMWWYYGLHNNLISILRLTCQLDNPSNVLDAGCGTGGFLAALKSAIPSLNLFGVDFEPVAASYASRKSGMHVRVGSINELPYESEYFDIIVSADVLCHRSVNQSIALSEFHRCLKPGGRLILNLPAYNWMMSAHDVAVHTALRYSAVELKRTLQASGFSAIETSYWNTFLFPIMVIRRMVTHTVGPSDVMLFPTPVESAFRAVMGVENFLIRMGLRLPFGGSVIASATK